MEAVVDSVVGAVAPPDGAVVGVVGPVDPHVAVDGVDGVV